MENASYLAEVVAEKQIYAAHQAVEAERARKSAMADLWQLQKMILRGEADTGDEIRNFVILHHGWFPKLENAYRNFLVQIKACVDEQVLLVIKSWEDSMIEGQLELLMGISNGAVNLSLNINPRFPKESERPVIIGVAKPYIWVGFYPEGKWGRHDVNLDKIAVRADVMSTALTEHVFDREKLCVVPSRDRHKIKIGNAAVAKWFQDHNQMPVYREVQTLLKSTR